MADHSHFVTIKDGDISSLSHNKENSIFHGEQQFVTFLQSFQNPKDIYLKVQIHDLWVLLYYHNLVSCERILNTSLVHAG